VVRLSETVPAEAPAADDLKRKALRSLGELPPFSAVLSHLLASLAGESVSLARLGDLIEKDTVVSANLVLLVNSTPYARRGTVNSVRNALSLMGIEKVRNAVLGMSIKRMWSETRMPASWSMARFNTHSASAAILSDLLAQRLEVEYPEGAFAAGLLHDVGRLILALALPEHHARIELLHATGRPRLDCEMEVLGFTHPMLSADALACWNIPVQIRIAVLDHHTPSGDLELSTVLDAANHYVNSTGASIAAGDPEWSDPTLIESLGLNDGSGTVLAEFAAEYSAMSAFFR
jgi:HD-like signal output (HDOD) protein